MKPVDQSDERLLSKPVLLSFLLAGGGLALSCRPGEETGKTASPARRAPDAVNAVAWVEGVAITGKELEAALRQRHPRPPAEGITQAQKQLVLEGLIREEALHARAVAAGFHRTPAIQSQIKKLVAHQYRKQQFPMPRPRVSEEKIRNYYSAHPDRFSGQSKTSYSHM
jgi:hypothetical protein